MFKLGDIKPILANLQIEIEVERGDEITALCPGHELRTGRVDQNPSWSINSETGVHHCFSCGYKGNILTLVAEQKEFYTEWNRLDLDGAKEWLRQNSKIDLQTLIKQMEDIKESYIAIPKPVPMSEARLALFSTSIPKVALDSRLLLESSAEHYGILWDTHNSRWILPIRTWEDNELLGWQEKGMKDRYFKNVPTGVSKSKTMFNSYNTEYDNRMIVVESPLDAVRLHSAGIEGGLASFGTSISPDQFKILRETKDLTFAFDNDDAGRTASLRMLDLCRKTGLECKFFNYSGIDFKDIGEMTDDLIHRGLETARHCVLGKSAVLGD